MNKERHLTVAMAGKNVGKSAILSDCGKVKYLIVTGYQDPMKGDDLVVFKDGNKLIGFNSLSDDYAYTSLAKFVEKLKKDNPDAEFERI